MAGSSLDPPLFLDGIMKNLRLLAALVVFAGIGVHSYADEWPQWRGENRDGVWKETGVVEKFASDRLKLRWKMPVSNGYSGPTVAEGKVYLTDRVIEPEQVERVHAFDWQTGEKAWSYSYHCPYIGVGYPDGPRASVLVEEGRAYSLGSMGHLYCFDAANGEVRWKKDLAKEFDIQMPIWGIASSPLIEGDLLIVQAGGKDACVVAFEKGTGNLAWKALSDRASYSAPIVIEQGGKRVLVMWTGDHLLGMNPRSGEVYWKHPFTPTRMVINIATPVVDQDRMFVSCFYDGSMMLSLDPTKPAADLLWRRLGPDEQHTDSLHSIISTPYLKGDYVYGVDSYGELRCLDAKTGDRIWEDLTATPKSRWSTIHMVQNGDRTWMFNERGELIISRLSPQGFEEISRTKLIEPTPGQLDRRGGVCWSHPAYAHKHVFARNDEVPLHAFL
jgi:outer membrane protein assembly factor BamB